MKKGLGRGLKAIIGENTQAIRTEENMIINNKKISNESADPKANVPRETSMIEIESYLIEPRKDQPREKIDEDSLRQLADSIREHGLLQPILVRKAGTGYEIVAGERRWRAARLAGLKRIPVLIKDLSDREVSEAALIENIQREDLNSVEEARAYKTLMDKYDLTQEILAHRLSKSRSGIANSLRLLNLDDEVLKMLEEDVIQAGHARAILGIKEKKEQIKVAKEVAEANLSVRDTEKLVRKYTDIEKKKNKQRQNLNTIGEMNQTRYRMYLDELASRLTDVMNTKVNIKPTGIHRGHIIIEYYSDEELNEITDKLYKE